MKILFVVALSLLGCLSMRAAQAQCALPNPYLGTVTFIPCWGWSLSVKQPPKVVLPAFKPLAWGTTPAAIKANFAANILYDVEVNANLNTVVTNAGTSAIARLSTELKALDTAGHTFYILAYAAEKLSAVNLRLLQSAFGPTAMTAAMAYATPAVRAAYNALPVRSALPYSQYAVSLGGKTPPYDLTQRELYDLYLDQYFSTNDTPNIALHKAVIYMQVRMKITLVEALAIAVSVIEIYRFIQSDDFTKIEDWWYTTGNNSLTNGQAGEIISIPLPSLLDYGVPNPDVPVLPPIDYTGEASFCVRAAGELPC